MPQAFKAACIQNSAGPDIQDATLADLPGLGGRILKGPVRRHLRVWPYSEMQQALVSEKRPNQNMQGGDAADNLGVKH
ncbi:MAG: hypothetical protein V3T80_10860 [Kiloniellales bacterium]